MTMATSESGGWLPANAVEQGMAAALASGDGPAYARLLRSAQLLVPDLSPAGPQDEALLAGLVPGGVPYVPAFTSRESLEWAFGDLARGYEEVGFFGLLQRWPDPRVRLAVNPGSPIAMFLPPRAVADLEAGRESLVAVEDVQRVVADEALLQIRRICLRELAGVDNVDSAGGLRDDPPANPLEAALREAVERPDGDAYLDALLAADSIVLPTVEPVTDPDRILDDDFPWRVVGGDQAKAIPVFSSTAMLERTCAGDPPRIEIGLLPVLAGWPGEEFQLYVNPGSMLELLLPGDTVLEIVGLLDD
jgi:hypothetical protein